jgi:transposase-like protein
MLKAELDVFLGYPKNERVIDTGIERNGHSQKTVKSQFRKVTKSNTIFPSDAA